MGLWGQAQLCQHFGVNFGFVDRAENSRIETVATIITSDEIHPFGKHYSLEATPVMAGHRRNRIFD